MHERSVVRSLLRQVEAIARREGARRVVRVRIQIGEFSGIEAELFRSAFEELVLDSPASGAELDLEKVALEARCKDCGEEFAIQRFRFSCPACGGAAVEILRGEELLLDSVTLERRETCPPRN